MKMYMLRNRKGMTVIEVVISTCLLSMVLIATLALFSTMVNLWTKGASGTSANSFASLAIRKLVLDVEEGKSASIVNGKLTVVFPYYDSATGSYDRSLPGSTAAYYLSGETGGESAGNTLWKSVGSTRIRLARHIESVSFIIQSSKLVRITLTGYDQEGGAISPKTEHLSIKLRNS